MEDADRILIRRVLEGSEAAFRELVEANQKLVWHIVSRMVPESDREDICQDVFLNVYRNLSKFKQQSKLSTWIGRIAHNRCLNYIEKKRPALFDDMSQEDDGAGEIPDESPGSETAAVESDIGDRLRREIDKLPIMYGTVLALFHLEEMKYDEIAEILQMPKGTVKSHLFRARKMLRGRLLARYEIEDLYS